MSSTNKNQSHGVAAIRRAVEISGPNPVEVVGSTTPTFLAWILAQSASWPKPRLVICSSEKVAEQCVRDIKALSPLQDVVLCEPFDESPYSGLYPSQASLQSRTHFLWRASHAKSSDIFVASIEALLQRTIPPEDFAVYEVHIKKGDELDLPLLLKQLVECGYVSAPLVEDGGAFSRRGDILDIFSPAHAKPVRIEFFGDTVESIRIFDIETQRSETDLEEAIIIPAREILLSEKCLAQGKNKIKRFCDDHGVGKPVRETLIEPLEQKIYPNGIDYWVSLFYPAPATPLSAFRNTPDLFWLDQLDITRAADQLFEKSRDRFRTLIDKQTAVCDPSLVYESFEKFGSQTKERSVYFEKIRIDSLEKSDGPQLDFKVFETSDFSTVVRAAREAKKDFVVPAAEKLLEWKKEGFACFVWAGTQTQGSRAQYLFETHGLKAELLDSTTPLTWPMLIQAQHANPQLIHVLPKTISHGGRFVDEGVVHIRDEDLFGERRHTPQARRTTGTLEERASQISFGDLNPSDHIVHTQHGIGLYEGLKKIDVQGIENEFIQLKYRDGDKLYLPVYRISQIQKFSGGGLHTILDKLGGTNWQKAKVKVRAALKDLASELLQLYARRASLTAFAFSVPDDDFREFEATFPYDETPDQAKAIEDVLEDMAKPRPMDRLVCGDVGFGKTEVAIRAAYKAVQDGKQVAVLVPTTVLAFQHHQTFVKRFADTPVRVGTISRLTPAAQVKKTLTAAAEGKVDIVIGTHRILSKDVSFKDLGLLVVDEEQRFGVTHKERIKKLKTEVHVLSMSATPIPRTLNMSLMGVRDLSIINTPPEDRLSIRTFVSRFDEETIKKAIESEISRGGQVYFIHNRVQSIQSFYDQIKKIVPHARIKIGHGQMNEELLEKTMVEFYHHDFDVLLCTTIIEAGLDIPAANTIIIDRADTFGLAQLYQLRGRVGRSKERAYAYLLIPPTGGLDKTALERLKIIQKYTSLGSGFHIAHHDLELRGGGNILGDDQSGHIGTVGYELYMELLEQALSEAKGEPQEEDVEPEINLRIPALFPDTYIEDIRIRLGYYKMLSDIRDEADLDEIEKELVDRFGELPEPVTNLFGVMLIRKFCRDLGVKDISSGPKNLSLLFSNSTKASPEAVLKLTAKERDKYQFTPDQRLIIRLKSTSWPAILEELKSLKKNLLKAYN